MFIIDNYKRYYISIKKDYKHLETPYQALEIAFLSITAIGFTHYSYKQYRDHKGAFNPIKLLMGTTTCRGN